MDDDHLSPDDLLSAPQGAVLIVRLQSVVTFMESRGVKLAGPPEQVRPGGVTIPLAPVKEGEDHGEGLNRALVLFPLAGRLRIDLIPDPPGRPDAVAYLRGVGIYTYPSPVDTETITVEDVEFEGLSRIRGPFTADLFRAEGPDDVAPVDWGGCRRDRPITLRVRPGDGATRAHPYILALIVVYDYRRLPPRGQGHCL